MTFTTASGRAVPLDYTPHFLPREHADALYDEFLRETPWAALRVRRGEEQVALTRLICWVGDVGYDFYGAAVESERWTAPLLEVRERVEAATGARFNSVLLNLYRSGSDLVEWHADSERALGETPTIASISLGSEREFRMRHRDSGELVSVPLAHGSLAVMRDDAQTQWEHTVPGVSEQVGPRINLTFRWFHVAEGRSESS